MKRKKLPEMVRKSLRVCVIAIISTAKTTTRIPVYSAGYVETPQAETPTEMIGMCVWEHIR